MLRDGDPQPGLPIGAAGEPAGSRTLLGDLEPMGPQHLLIPLTGQLGESVSP